MWKNASSLTGTRESASTGGGEEFWPLSTDSGAHGSFPQHTPSYPHLSVDNQDAVRPGIFDTMRIQNEYLFNQYSIILEIDGSALRGGETSVPFCSHRKEPMAQATLSCPFGAIHLENRWGPPSMSAFAERALKVAPPPGPPFAWDACLVFMAESYRRTKSEWLAFLASGTQAPSSSQSPLYSGRPSMGIRPVASLLLLSPPNPLRWALAGTPIKCLRCTDIAYSGKTRAAAFVYTQSIGRA